MLERVKPLQNRQLRITSRSAKPPSKLFIWHARIVPGDTTGGSAVRGDP
jgi:hypothetical protein